MTSSTARRLAERAPQGFSGAAVEILVDRKGRVFFLDLPPDFVPIARALDPDALPRHGTQNVAPDEAGAVASRTSRDAKR